METAGRERDWRGARKREGRREAEREREKERGEGMREGSGETKRKRWDGGGEGEGGELWGGQPMQILGKQRANQGGRQPLQRSEPPLVTGGRVWGGWGGVET